MSQQALALAVFKKMHLLIVCPDRRISYFEATAQVMCEAGYPIASLSRIKGFDWNLPATLPKDVQVKLLKSQWLMYFFEKRFIQRAKVLFKASKHLRYVVWIEDDCRPMPVNDDTPLMVSALADQFYPSIAWLGFTKHNQATSVIWGAHFLVFTQPGLLALANDLATIKANAKKPFSYLLGFDSYLSKFVRDSMTLSCGAPVIRLPQATLMTQHAHALKGRH